MSEVLATEPVAVPARKKANGAAGPVRVKVEPGQRFGTANTLGQNRVLRAELTGGVLLIVYNPRRLSLQEHLDISAIIDAQDPERPRMTWLTEWLSRIIVSWEYYLNPDDPEDDRRYPLDPASLMQLNGEFIAEVADKIREDMNPPESATPSSSFT